MVESAETTTPPSDRRSRLYRDRAIVLRRRDLGETDRLLTLLTASHGKQRVVAKGTRRPGSRLAGHLEPFGISSVLIARTRGLDIVSQAETLVAFSQLRTSERAIATAGYLAELVDAMLPEAQPQESIFDLLCAVLDLLDDDRDTRTVSHVFEMGLLRQLGYRPQLDPCIACGTVLSPVMNGFSSEGGVVCDRCLSARSDVMPLGVNTLKVLRAIDRGEIDRLFKLNVPAEVWVETATIMGAYIGRLVGRESQALRVMRQLRLE